VTDAVIMGSVLRQVMSESHNDSTVLFVSDQSPTHSDRGLAEAIAKHAGLRPNRSGWAIASVRGEPNLDEELEQLALGARCHTAVLVPVAGANLDFAHKRDDTLEVVILEIG